MLATEPEPRRRRYVGLVLCVIVGITLGVLHNRAYNGQRPDPVTNAARRVTVPLVSGTRSVFRWFADGFNGAFHGRAIVAQNRQIMAENARLREEIARLTELEVASQRLRQQLGFDISPYRRRIAASVVSLRPTAGFETLVIGRGSSDGIRVRDVVVAQGGIVGQVFGVGADSASVMMLSDRNSAIGARIQRGDSRATGICRGTGQAELDMEYVSRDASVRVGDTVVSSGLGGQGSVYPKGLPIGTVTAVTDDKSGATRIVKVKPIANFDRIEEAYVLQ